MIYPNIPFLKTDVSNQHLSCDKVKL